MADEKQGMVPFVGFAPDDDPLTPGIWLDCDGLVGTKKGFRPEPGDQLAYGTFPSTFILYDRTTPADIYAITFGEVISFGISPGAAKAGILLNNGWNLYVDMAQLKFDQVAHADLIIWDNSHTLLVDEVNGDMLIYAP